MCEPSFAAGDLVYLVYPVYSQIYPEGTSDGLGSPPATPLWTTAIEKDDLIHSEKRENVWMREKWL